MSEVLTIILGIIAFILVLGIIVLIHELGHFFFAKRAGILCYEFSIGMGPIVWRKKKGETLYSIRLFPIGGFVSMAGEEIEFNALKDVKKIKFTTNENGVVDKLIVNVNNPQYADLPLYFLENHDIMGSQEAKSDELYIEVRENENNETVRYTVLREALINLEKDLEIQIAPLDRNTSSKSIGKRFMTVFGGPMMNFILALIIYVILGCCQGYADYSSTKVSTVTSDAAVYGILDKNDVVTSISATADTTNPLTKWDDISTQMDAITRDPQFNGTVYVTYLDASDNNTQKTAEVYPQVLIYSIELFFTRDKINPELPKVGSHASEDTNKKTKSYIAGLREGDIITKLVADKYEKTVTTKADVIEFFTNTVLAEGQKVEVYYTRDSETGHVNVETYSKKMLESQNIPQVKVQLGISPIYSFNFVKLLYMPFVNTWDSVSSIFKTIGLLFTDKSVGVTDLSGPVGIFNLIVQTTSSGILPLLSLAAFLSVNIGFVNLLPLPALDGGRLAFIAYEGVTRKKPNAKIENIIHSIGFLLLIGLVIIVSISDIIRCFS